MKRFIVAGAIAVAVAVSGSAFAADGAAIFKAKCAACHGQDANGTAMAPSLKASPFVKSSKEADIEATITNGRKGDEKHYKQFPMAMPPKGGDKNLSADDIKAIVAHLKTVSK